MQLQLFPREPGDADVNETEEYDQDQQQDRDQYQGVYFTHASSAHSLK